MADPSHIGVLLDVSDILHAAAESLHEELDVPIDEIEVGSEVFAPLGPAHVDITLTYAGTAIVAEGSVAATLRTVCVRCLEEVDLTVRGTIEGFYVPHGTEHELPEEQDYEFIEGTSVDVLPAIRSALILEIPFAPVHPSGCVAVCPGCGEPPDSCACDSPADGSPFAALKDLFPPHE